MPERSCGLERERRARLANLRREPLAPVTALVGYGESLVDQARRLELGVGFTTLASRVTPADLVDNLNRIFSEFDALCHELGIEKIKTIGDATWRRRGCPSHVRTMPR
jgi:class 3 adenylate cyclase